MRPGGMEVPINGDVVVSRHITHEGERYIVHTYPGSQETVAYGTRDEAVAVATAMAARDQVSVFLWELPHAPTLLRPFRTL
ncbi:MAG: hypothetical protein V7647_1903 [Acidobacteriota bacterium]|jgi:hypothetical protein